MKKISRSLALLLAILMTFSVAACAHSDDPQETTESETADTTAPETTEINIAITTEEPEVSTAPAPETTEDTAPPPETEPPKASDTIRIIMQNGVGEAILSGLAEEKYKSTLQEREKALLFEHGLEIELSRTEDLAKNIKNLVLSGEYKYDLILTDPLAGTEMLSFGLLRIFPALESILIMRPEKASALAAGSISILHTRLHPIYPQLMRSSTAAQSFRQTP